ncbi:late embryogenesis abundant protein 6-like [Argentina anserina]|uniref:late embryogenesis abundant protein 6-like n=1 Tax=Argentina anserina TaxID=57926 RepID=UPI0021766271|nr:late embryogenesis abundant protein 6-like [Potentilla anserina]
MQAVKDKLSEMSAMKQVKEEARAEEKAEKEIAKARADIAHEVRLAKEAEATMVHHVAKAGEIARAGEQMANEQLAKHGGSNATTGGRGGDVPNTAASNPLPTTNMSPPTYNKMS